MRRGRWHSSRPRWRCSLRLAVTTPEAPRQVGRLEFGPVDGAFWLQVEVRTRSGHATAAQRRYRPCRGR